MFNGFGARQNEKKGYQVKKSLFLFAVLLSSSYHVLAQTDPYAGRTTENDGLGKYERINLIERKVLALEDKSKDTTSSSKDVELLKTQVQSLTAQVASLKELSSLKDEVQRLARKSAQIEIELAVLKARREQKVELPTDALPEATK